MSALASAAPPAPARDHCLAPSRVVDAPLEGGRYGRLFPHLPPLEAEERRLHAVGAVSGPCHCTADDERLSDVPAGWPFFGQFVAHDITADRSPLVFHADLEHVRNFRSPRANLECVYGAGPVGSPYLYDRRDQAKLLLAPSGRDVPRNEQGIALIGDPRNDVHLFVNQLQVVMLRTHNVLVDRLREDGVDGNGIFEEARRALTWHYQWVLLNDFLPSLVGEELALGTLRDGPTLLEYKDGPFIPLEFADAAYRYGHSQIRNSYRIDPVGGEVPIFPGLIGFHPVGPELALEWSVMFDLPGRPPAQRAKRIDGTLPTALIELPVEITGTGSDPDYNSLATRDLERGEGTGLPSGEAVARELGEEPLSPEEIGLGADWTTETPLWFYILREADARTGGAQLGPVGGRIVAETLVAVVDGDPGSFRSVDRSWRPTLPGAAPGVFGIADLIGAAALPG